MKHFKPAEVAAPGFYWFLPADEPQIGMTVVEVRAYSDHLRVLRYLCADSEPLSECEAGATFIGPLEPPESR